jgi:hypothetical protein
VSRAAVPDLHYLGTGDLINNWPEGVLVGSNPFASAQNTGSYIVYSQPPTSDPFPIGERFWSGFWPLSAAEVAPGWVAFEVFRKIRFAYASTGTYYGARVFGVGAVDMTKSGAQPFGFYADHIDDPWLGHAGLNLGTAWTINATLNAFNIHFGDDAEAYYDDFVETLEAGNLALYDYSMTMPGVTARAYAMYVEFIYPAGAGGWKVGGL